MLFFLCLYNRLIVEIPEKYRAKPVNPKRPRVNPIVLPVEEPEYQSKSNSNSEGGFCITCGWIRQRNVGVMPAFADANGRNLKPLKLVDTGIRLPAENSLKMQSSTKPYDER